MAIESGLSALVDRLQTETKNVVILASGDPLFYGIGSYLSSKIKLEIYPYLSSDLSLTINTDYDNIIKIVHFMSNNIFKK